MFSSVSQVLRVGCKTVKSLGHRGIHSSQYMMGKKIAVVGIIVVK